MNRLRFAWRVLLHVLRIRRFTPAPFGLKPDRSFVVAGDTGGGGWYRPAHRQQDPSDDPAEPKDESSSVGNDHGWSNCTMASGAMALDFHTEGALQKWGGHLRHRQGDLSGGTDLYDLRDAWESYGEKLTIRSGAGWNALKEDRNEGRFIVIQGEGNVPGSATFDGGHACALGPETKDGKWLWGDPLATGWQWVSPDAIKEWAQRWNSSISYATSAARKPLTSSPDPEPLPPDTGGSAPDSYNDGYVHGFADGVAAEADRTFASWFGTVVPDPPPGVTWAGDCGGPMWDRNRWSAPWPVPMARVAAAETPAAWDSHVWTGGLWT